MENVNANELRTGMTTSSLRKAIVDHLRYTLGRPAQLLEPQHFYHALALAVRDRMQSRWIDTTQTYLDLSRKVAVYLSAEFLLGPHLGNNLLNLGLEEEARAALAELGQDYDVVLDCEEEPGLGNGGLGRLAACYMESLATLQRPAIGYGIRYEFGIFDQEIRDGWQVERTDNWLAAGQPVGDRQAGTQLQGRLGRAHRALHRRSGRGPGALVARAGHQGRLLRHPDPGLRRQHLQHPDAVERQRRQRPRPGSLQRRGLLPRGRGPGGVRERHQGALPQRRTRGRQATPAAAAVLLRLMLAAGHPAHGRGLRAGDRTRSSQPRRRSSSTTPTPRSRWPN